MLHNLFCFCGDISVFLLFNYKVFFLCAYVNVACWCTVWLELVRFGRQKESGTEPISPRLLLNPRRCCRIKNDFLVVLVFFFSCFFSFIIHSDRRSVMIFCEMFCLQKDEVYLNLVLEYIPETVYKVARHYSKSKQTIPISFIKVSGNNKKTYFFSFDAAWRTEQKKFIICQHDCVSRIEVFWYSWRCYLLNSIIE